MKTLTIQTHYQGLWRDAALVTFYKPEQGFQSQARVDYYNDYVLESLSDPALPPVGGQYPVDFCDHLDEHWPPFLADLMPGGAGKARWVTRLGVSAGKAGDLAVLARACVSPVGQLRVKEAFEAAEVETNAAPAAGGQVYALGDHPGFLIEDVLDQGEHFVEYAYQLGAHVAGASGAQGEAPKFLLNMDGTGHYHAAGALPSKDVHEWVIVKFARGTVKADYEVLRNEAPYLEVARAFGCDVAAALTRHDNALFIPRFDRYREAGEVVRLGMESLLSVAGVTDTDIRPSHETFLAAFMPLIHEEDRPTAALEYVRRDLINLVMGNTDNHGRNTQLLRGPDERVRLSPLFDFAPMYLDPALIARVTRWGTDIEPSGRAPIWARVPDAFAEWVDTEWLLVELGKLAAPLAALPQTMKDCGVEAEIIKRNTATLPTHLPQLEALRDQ